MLMLFPVLFQNGLLLHKAVHYQNNFFFSVKAFFSNSCFIFAIVLRGSASCISNRINLKSFTHSFQKFKRDEVLKLPAFLLKFEEVFLCLQVYYFIWYIWLRDLCKSDEVQLCPWNSIFSALEMIVSLILEPFLVKQLLLPPSVFSTSFLWQRIACWLERTSSSCSRKRYWLKIMRELLLL